MKKLIIILAAAFSFNAATAQNRNGNYNNAYNRHPQQQMQNNRGNNGRWDDRAYNNNRNDQYGRNDQYNRQADYDRMNRECDQQIQVYRNDRSMNNYERTSRINEVERDRQQKANAFGKGLIVGGVAAVLIGAIIGH